jgi:hypothetical protein
MQADVTIAPGRRQNGLMNLIEDEVVGRQLLISPKNCLKQINQSSMRISVVMRL